MSRYENIFDEVGSARPLNNWAPSIPEGKHQVALVKYGCKVSGKDKSVFLEAEVIVLETNNEEVTIGARYSCPWFINKPDEFGYTRSRAKDFLQTVQKCIGNNEDVKSFGTALTDDFETDDPQAFGIRLDVTVSPVLDSKGEARRGKKGNEVFNSTWSAIPQSGEDIEATRAHLREIADQPKQLKQHASKPAQKSAEKTDEAISTFMSNGKKTGGLPLLTRRS